jgi:hypothetical protein
MDLEYQHKAFEALSDSKKKAMLTNSKIKNETVLQSAGMSNLGVRLRMQEHGYTNIKKEITNLNTKVRKTHTLYVDKYTHKSIINCILYSDV